MQDDELKVRLQQLEARLAALERRLEAGQQPVDVRAAAKAVVSPVPARASSAAPWPQAPQPEGPQPAQPPPGVLHRVHETRERRPRDLERFFGLAVLGRVGIAALVLAAAYFGQLGWSNLPPVGRVLSVYALAAALFAVGVGLRPKVAPRYTALLWGGAVALSYLAGVLAHLRYDLLGPLPALLTLLASAALGQWLAHRLRIEAIATVALGGAFAAPVLVATESTSPTSLFVLLLALHSWAAWTERRWSWFWSRGVAVAAASLLGCAWYATHSPGSSWSVVLHAELLLLGIAAPELLAAFALAQVVRWRWLLLLATTTLLQFTLLQFTAARGELDAFGVVMAVVWGAAGAVLNGRAPQLGRGMARLGTVLLPLGAWLVASGLGSANEPLPHRKLWQLGALVAAAAALFAARRWTVVADLGIAIAAVVACGHALGLHATASHLHVMVAIAAAVAVSLLIAGRARLAPTFGMVLASATLLRGWWPYGGFHSEAAHWASLALAAAAAVATAGVVRAARRSERLLSHAAVVQLAMVGVVWLVLVLQPATVLAERGMTPFWNWRALSVVAVGALVLAARRMHPPGERRSRAVLGGVLLVLTFVGGLLEVLEVLALIDDLRPAWRAVVTSLYTLLYAAALLTAGFWRNEAALRWCGLAGFAIVAGKVTLFDLAEVDTPLRVLATGALGVVLLVGAWAYSRRRDEPEQ